MRALVLGLVLLPLGGCVTHQEMARASSRVELGVAYYREGSLEQSLMALQEAHKLDPRNWRALDALAIVYIAKGRDDLAEDAFKRAVRLNPTEAEVLVNYGAFLSHHGRNDEAIGAYEKALADMDYKSPSIILSNLSYTLTQAGRPADGIARAREALRRTPTLCEAWYNLRLAQEAQPDVAGALDSYAQLEKTCPKESVGGRLRAGCLLAHAGNHDARAELESVVDEVPNTPLSDQARQCLALLGSG